MSSLARRWCRSAAVAVGLVVVAGGWWLVSGDAAVGGRPSGARLAATRASPQWKDGRFRNRLDRRDAPFLKSFTSWARGADHTAPDEPPPLEARRRRDFGDAPRGLRITWLGHSTTRALTLTATPARHFSVRSMVMADRDATLWAGWAIRGPEHRVYYSGDTAMLPDFSEIGRRLGPFDASLVEVGAYDALWSDVHLGPEQAVEAHRLVRGGVLIPVHWGTFDLALHPWTEPVERLLVAASRAGTRVAIPKPGEMWMPTTPPPVARWWPDVPWRTAEVAPIVSTGLRATSEVRPRSAG
jgi:hypothetical protein